MSRGPHGRLTATGERPGRRLIKAYDGVEAALIEACHEARDRPVSGLSSFLTLWLVPRLTRFQSQYEDTRLLLSTDLRPWTCRLNRMRAPFVGGGAMP